ncbi:MAG: ABC transporter substrate-binding protein, partial [Pyrobaculum sp.]
AAALLLTQGPAATPTPTPAPTPTPTPQVTIGALMPLTGGLQSPGIGARDAIALAVEDANAMCKNVKFQVVVEDTGTDPIKALEKLQTLYARGVKVVIGPMSSGEVSAVRSFADQNKIIIFSPSSTSPLLALSGDWIYRIVPTDFAQAKAVVDLVKYLNIKKIVILYRRDAWGEGLKDAISKEAGAVGIQVVAAEGYDRDPKAFPTAIPPAIKKLSDALKTPESAALIFVTFEDDGLVAIREAAADPVLSKVRWIGTDGIAFSESLIKQVGREMAAGKLLGTTPSPDPKDPKYVEFKEKYKAKYGREAVAYDPYSYDAAMMIMQIICQLGSADPDKVRATLEQWGKDGKYTGVTGKVFLDENGDRAYPNYLIYGVVITDG